MAATSRLHRISSIFQSIHGLRRRASSTSTDKLRYCQLDKRGLLRVSGKDSVKLLQGIVTNNIELFHQDTTMETMYCMVLNAQGRALYDCMIYKYHAAQEIPGFFIECDKSAVNSLTKLLKMYKLRSKVNITSDEDVVPWVVFNDNQSDPCVPDIKDNNLISMGRDPRVSGLGWRLLMLQNTNPEEVMQHVTKGKEGTYEVHRIQLGVSEGTDEIKPGVALPLEYNLDYMNGVSFQKGCYIGQELTARTHHTGVIRKRILPFTFHTPESVIKLEHGTAIKTSNGKTSGKLCVLYGQYGLAIMRMATISKDKYYIQDNEGKDVEVCPYIPKWWPKDTE